MSTRQGSASYTIVIGAVVTLLIGAMLLTFMLFPIFDGFTTAAFWSADTTAGVRVNRYTKGIWEFWGAIMLFGVISYIWVHTRQ